MNESVSPPRLGRRALFRDKRMGGGGIRTLQIKEKGCLKLYSFSSVLRAID